MNTGQDKPTKRTRRRPEQIDAMLRLLRAIDKTLAAADEVKRHRDKLYRLTPGKRGDR